MPSLQCAFQEHRYGGDLCTLLGSPWSSLHSAPLRVPAGPRVQGQFNLTSAFPDPSGSTRPRAERLLTREPSLRPEAGAWVTTWVRALRPARADPARGATDAGPAGWPGGSRLPRPGSRAARPALGPRSRGAASPAAIGRAAVTSPRARAPASGSRLRAFG